MPLAYVDVRPIVFLGGLPVFFLLGLLACRLLGASAGRGKVAVLSSASWATIFVLFMTGFGPFVDQTDLQEHRMTWKVQASDPALVGLPASEPLVELSFADHPGHFLWITSGELAEHLQAAGQEEVLGLFETTSDYGRLRGYNLLEIAGLRGWAAGRSAGGTRGDPASSPWD